MKKPISLPVFLLCGGAALFACRLAHSLTGFTPEGLPIRGALFGRLTLLLALILVDLWALLCRRLPKQATPGLGFPEHFALDQRKLLPLITGLFLLLLSGGLEIGMTLTGGGAMEAINADGTISAVALPSPLSPGRLMLTSATALLTGLGLFPAVIACRKAAKQPAAEVQGEALQSERSSAPFSPTLLLLVPVCLVLRLVLLYRLRSADPVISHYAGETLALTFGALAYYRLGGFACGSGNPQRFAVYGGAGFLLSLVAAAESHGPFSLLFFLGLALSLFGFLLPLFSAPRDAHRETNA